MSEQNTSRAIRYVPQVVVATVAVAVLPVLVVWWLHDRGTVSSPWVCFALAVALSLAASFVGNAYWQRRRGSGDIFFSEILLWGWLYRLRAERRLTKTAGLLGLDEAGHGLIALGHARTTGDEGLERTGRLLREMATALDAQDPYTEGHSRRVALHCAMVGRKMGLDRDEILKIRTAAAVHDIGKLRIPLELLNKPGELSEQEFEIVKRHVDDGAEIVSSIEDPEITAMVRHHHERFDGTGYPSGLTGEEIPLGARIIAVADTFDALTSVRPYRNAIPHKRALEAIVGVSAAQLDPAVVRAFLRCYSGNRAALFWTLLLVSPQRALALIRGKGPGRGNLAATAASVATPAALTAVVAAALGSGSSLATAQPPVRLAQQAPVAAAAPPHATTRKRPHRSSATASSPAAHRASSSVLGIRVSRGALSKHSIRASGVAGAGSGHGAGSGAGGSSGGHSGGGHGNPPSSAPKQGPGGTATTPATFTPPPSGSGPPLAVSLPPTTVASTPAAPTNPPGGGSGSTSPPAGGSTGGDPGGGTGSPGAGGSTTGPGGSQGGSGPGSGGNQGGAGSGGNQGSGSGGSQGSGGSGPGGSNGSGGGGSGSGSLEPSTKDDCKNDGYKRYGFTNQGQCVSYVERKLHH